MKKFLCVVVSALLCVCAMGCVGTFDDGSGFKDFEKYESRPRSFTFSYYASGYGSDWVAAVAKDYMDNVNQNVYVNPKTSYDNNQARENIRQGIGYDLYQLEVDMFRNSDYVADLSALYEKEVYGEPGVKVKDKIAPRWVDYYNEGGKWYQLPQTTCTGWNWVYNKTLLDDKLGEGQYTLPRTTDEFFEFGDMLIEKGVFLTAFSGDTTNGADYTPYAYQAWFAQMMGAEAYDHFFDGEYTTDGGHTWTFASESAAELLATSATARTEAYRVAEKLATAGNHYMHSSSPSMQYTNVNNVVYGGKMFATTVAPFAFHYTGAWLETEVAPAIERGTITKKDVRAMKMPVVSKITERLTTVNDDDTLRAVIDYVDGTTSTKPAGVSDEDITVVAEARGMVAELICRSFVVSKNAKNKDDILDFLAYLCSDRAQKIAAQATQGFNVLPYGYTPTD